MLALFLCQRKELFLCTGLSPSLCLPVTVLARGNDLAQLVGASLAARRIVVHLERAPGNQAIAPVPALDLHFALASAAVEACLAELGHILAGTKDSAVPVDPGPRIFELHLERRIFVDAVSAFLSHLSLDHVAVARLGGAHRAHGHVARAFLAPPFDPSVEDFKEALDLVLLREKGNLAQPDAALAAPLGVGLEESFLLVTKPPGGSG